MESAYFLGFMLVVQQIYHSYVLNKLVNKIMSRNYAEYEQSKPVKKEDIKIKLNQEAAEDLGYLSGFRPNG